VVDSAIVVLAAAVVVVASALRLRIRSPLKGAAAIAAARVGRPEAAGKGRPVIARVVPVVRRKRATRGAAAVAAAASAPTATTSSGGSHRRRGPPGFATPAPVP